MDHKLWRIVESSFRTHRYRPSKKNSEQNFNVRLFFRHLTHANPPTTLNKDNEKKTWNKNSWNKKNRSYQLISSEIINRNFEDNIYCENVIIFLLK